MRCVLDFRSAIQYGVVDPLLAGEELFAFDGPDYESWLNSPYVDESIGWDGYWSSQNAVTNLLTHLSFDYGEDCRNFFFEGHGGEATLADGPSNTITMALNNVKYATGNRIYGGGALGAIQSYIRPHPYRFVFLDACDTATGDGWAMAFGIQPSQITAAQLTDRPDQVQAFVGWVGKSREPGSSSEWDDYGDTISYIFCAWMQGERLDNILNEASHTDPFGDGSEILNFPLGIKFSYLSGGGYSPSTAAVNKFHIKIFGYSGITRTGYE